LVDEVHSWRTLAKARAKGGGVGVGIDDLKEPVRT
jgi:hypothetical protein